MLVPTEKHAEADRWKQGLAAQLASQARSAELKCTVRSVDEALIQDDLAEVLAKFERAVVLFAQERRWHEGLGVARRVHEAVARWDDFDAAPYALTVAQFAHNYAIDLQQASVHEAALDYYAEALGIFQTYGDSRRALVTAYQMGRLQQDQGEYRQAAQSYRASLEIAREQLDCLHVAKNLLQLGQLAQLTGQSQKSASLYREVLALAETPSSAPLWTAAAHQLGIVEQASGNYVQAQNWFDRAFERALQNDDARGAADALHQLGMVAQAQGELARAEELYYASLVFSASFLEPGEQAPTLYQLAQCAHIRGDYETAENLCQRSLTLLQAQGNVEGIGRVRQLLNSIQADIARTVAALQNHSSAGR